MSTTAHRSRKLQLALDVLETADAVRIARASADSIDIVEAGTILCLSEGMHAVRALREALPGHHLLADIRAGRVGDRLAKLAFDAGADSVTVLAEVPDRVVTGALRAAAAVDGAVAAELHDTWTEDDVHRLVDLGVRHIVAHRTYDSAFADDEYIASTVARLAALELPGVEVSLAGGIALADVDLIGEWGFDTLVVGSGIAKAEDPAAAARDYATRLRSVTKVGVGR